MPTFTLTSQKTGQDYDVDFERDPTEVDVDEALASLDQDFYRAQGLDPSIAEQGPAGTVVNQVRNVGPGLVGGLLANAGRVMDAGSKLVEQGLVSVFGDNEFTRSEGLFQDAADVGDRLLEAGQELRPTNPANKVSNVVGSGLQQGLGLVATMGASAPFIGPKAAVTTLPLVTGGIMGGGEGVQTARDLGIESPAGQLATGAAFAGAEILTERLAGVGNKAATEALQRGLAGTLKEAGKTIGGEAIEEPISGALQEGVTRVAGEFVADPKRPGYTTTGAPLPTMEGFVQRRALEAVGGAAGGLVFAGVGAVASGQAQPSAQAPAQPVASEDLGDLTAADVVDLETPAPVRPPLQPILSNVPDRAPEVAPQIVEPIVEDAPVLPAAESPGPAPVQATGPAVPVVAEPQAAPVAEFDLFGEAIDPEPATSYLDQIETSEVPLEQLSLSSDVPQFKDGANAEGVVEPLEGKYQRLGTGPILVWERLNGKREVISGRHRFDLAKRTGEKTIPSQVVREADGFTLQHAITADAELNIRDGQGKAKDYANYFRHSQQPGSSREEAEARGLLGRSLGRSGWTIGTQASEAVFDLHANDKLSTQAAEALARTAPNNEALQRVGAQSILDGQPIDVSVNLMRAMQSELGSVGTADQLDLFGSNDSAMQAMKSQAKRATDIQRGIKEQISAVQGAAKRPDQAKKLGVDVKDPASILKRVDVLKTELLRWENWPMHADLREQVRGEQRAPNAAAPAPADLGLLLEGTESTRPANKGETSKPQDADPLAELFGAKQAGEADQAQGKLGFKNTRVDARHAGYLGTAHIDAMINLAGAAIRAGKSFAQWAGEMLRQFGTAVQSGLKATWAAALKLNATDAAKNVRMGAAPKSEPVRLSSGGFVAGSSKPKETRSRYARPEEKERMYETRADVVVKAAAEAWLAGQSMADAVAAMESGNLPAAMTGDVAQHAAGLLIQRTMDAQRTGGELEQMQARTLSHRIAKVWQGRLSQEAGRNLRQRAVVNSELVPYAPVLAAEGVLIDRAEATLGTRFEGGAGGVVAKVKAILQTAEIDITERVERILAAVMGPRLAPSVTVAEAMKQILGGKTQREELLDDVAKALAQKAKMRVVSPQRQTALAALAASLKRTLGASIKGDALKAAPASLGETLARAFVDQVAEAQTFRDAWEAGRVAVFDMLFDMELDKAYHPARMRRQAASERLQHLKAGNAEQQAASAGERASLEADIAQLEAEMRQAMDEATAKTDVIEAQRDKLMPNTPTMAYAPGVARDAVRRGFEQAGYTAELSTGMDKSGKRTLSMRDALRDRARALAAVLRVWDAEAAAAGISPEAWRGARGIATAALNETLDNWQTKLDEQTQAKAEEQRGRLLAKDSPALVRLLNELRAKIAPDMSWTDIFSDMPGSQKDRQREIYRRIMLDERLKGLSQDERLALTNELNKAWQRERQAVFNRELKRAGVLGEKDAGDRAKVEKALPKLIRLINLGVFNSEMFREAIAPEYGLRQITSAEAQKLRTLAEEAYKMPEGLLRNRKLSELLFGIRKATGSSWIEVITSYWTSAVLSGLRTMWDTFGAVSNGLLTNVLQSAGQLMQGRGAAAAQIQAQWWRSLAEGIREAGLIIATGDRSYTKRFGEDLRKALAGERNHGPLPVGEMLWQNGNAFGKWIGAPIMLWTGRLMEAADHINNTATTEGAKAVARAMHPELYARASWSDQERTDARAQALREVTGGRAPNTLRERADVARRAREILAQGLRPEDLEAANTVGDMAAFQNDPTGAFGMLYNGMKQALSFVERKLGEVSEDVTANAFTRGAAAVMGSAVYGLTGTRFMRFGANFGAEITRYMPGSFALQYGNFYGRDISAQERQLLLGKNIIGLAILMTLAAQFGLDEGEDDEWHIEGDWSNLSPDEQRQRMSSGVARMSMWRRVNGKVQSVSYKQWPTMGLFAAVGGMADERRYKPQVWQSRGPAGHLLRGAMTGLFQVQNVSAMRNLVEVFGTQQVGADPVTGWVERFGKQVTNYAGGFIPTLMKDAEAWNDPRNFKPEGVMEQLVRSVPILRTTINDGRPQLNLLGEEVKLQRAPWSRTYTSVESGEAHRVLGGLLARGLSLPEPDTSRKMKINGQSVSIKELGREAEWKYQRAVGQAYKAWLATEGQALLAMPDVQLQRVIEHRAKVFKIQAANSLRVR